MKRITILVGGLLLLGQCLRAQVTVDVVMDEQTYIAGEPVPVAVRITNHSGQTLQLGKDADWLSFNVEARDNFIVPRLGDVPVQGEFPLESSHVATKRADLAPSFQLTTPGRYTVTVTVKVPQWERELVSKPKSFEVNAGSKLWEQDFGVPGESARPDERKFALLQAIHRKQLRLYVRVTDKTESRIYRTLAIGPMVSFSKPEPQIDKLNNLHVLYQTGAHDFNYSVLNWAGEVLVRQTYEYTATRPVLRIDKDGNVGVAGGARRIEQSDVPAPTRTAPPESDVKPPKP